MRQHAASHRAFPVLMARGAWGDRLLRFTFDRFLLLPLGAAIALVWANTAPESYFRFAQTLAFPVNEIGMALFLALIAQEVVEAVMPGGVLHTWRRWSMALVAAAGGVAGSAFVFLAYVFLRHEQVLTQAWPIACSIDMAASYYLLKLVYRRASPLAFLLLLAIATNIVGLVVLAVWPALTPGHLTGGLLVAGAVTIAAVLRARRVRAFWPYFVFGGTISWAGFYWAGVHPALALVPIVPFLPHEPRTREVFADPPDDDAVHHAEHEWNEVVQVVIFLFGLVNAGVLLGGHDTGTWAILAAALIGRPVGILAAVALARGAGLRLPAGIGWADLVVIALATSAGFTLALFFASGLLPVGGVLQQIKLGALATVAGAALALGAAKLLRVGRWARRAGT